MFLPKVSFFFIKFASTIRSLDNNTRKDEISYWHTEL